MGGKSAALAIPIRGAQTAELNLDTGSDVQAELAKYYVGTLLADSAASSQERNRYAARAAAAGASPTGRDVRHKCQPKLRSNARNSGRGIQRKYHTFW